MVEVEKRTLKRIHSVVGVRKGSLRSYFAQRVPNGLKQSKHFRPLTSLITSSSVTFKSLTFSLNEPLCSLKKLNIPPCYEPVATM